MENEREVITWMTPEYEHIDRGNDWFWAVGVIAIAICVTAIIFKNYLFGVLILLAAGALAYINIRKPEDVLVKINHRGIKIKEDFYLYQNIKNFWVEPDHTHTETRHLLLMTNRFFLPQVVIRIPNERADEIREYLLEYIEETEMHENESYKMLEKLGL